MQHLNKLPFAFLSFVALLDLGCSAESSSVPGGDLPGTVGVSRSNLTVIHPGGSTGHNMTFTQCALENQMCNVGTSRYVAFGTDTRFTFRTVSSPFWCTTDSFGTDPAPGVAKACYFSSYTQGTQAVSPFSNVWEGMTMTAIGNVAFGENGYFNFKTFNSLTTFTCDRTTFGGDPIPGVLKGCFVLADYRYSVPEHAVMQAYFAPVAYGANGNFTYKIVSGINLPCDNSTFPDPISGVVKACYVLPAPFLASEGGSFDLGNSGGTFYGSGSNGVWAHSNMSKGSCTNTFFGLDPDFGNAKYCFGPQN